MLGQIGMATIWHFDKAFGRGGRIIKLPPPQQGNIAIFAPMHKQHWRGYLAYTVDTVITFGPHQMAQRNPVIAALEIAGTGGGWRLPAPALQKGALTPAGSPRPTPG